MWKFIQAAWAIWATFQPVFGDAMKAIKRVRETDLTDDDARNAVKQEITDLIQNHAMKNINDQKMNAGIEIAYQVYLMSKKA